MRRFAGTVRDSSGGAAVPDAAIELTDVARGLRRTTQANEEGAFLFPRHHTRRISTSCHAKKVRSAGIRNITVEIGQRASFDMELKPGQVSSCYDRGG